MDGLDIIVLELKNKALGTRGKGRMELVPAGYAGHIGILGVTANAISTSPR